MQLTYSGGVIMKIIKVSELIEMLEAARAELGDVEVHSDPRFITGVEINREDTRPGWECPAHVYLI